MFDTLNWQAAEGRLKRWMLLAAGLGLLAAAWAGGFRPALAFAAGAAVALLNFRWMHQVVRTLMEAAVARPSPWVIAKFLARYPLAFAGVYVCYKTGWLPFAWVLYGLFVPVAGVLVEACLQTALLMRGGTEAGGGPAAANGAAPGAVEK